MSKKEMPNIFIIMTDQHSKHFIGEYGNSLVRTPNLDSLCRQGMRFTNTYCPSPLCVPSRMSFMTSMTPSKNEVWDNSQILHSGIPTWATMLTLQGYDTALLGRMHFNGPDQRFGFSTRPIGETNTGYVGTPVKGGPLWTRFPGSTSGQSRISVEKAGRGHTHYQWADEERTKKAIAWLKDQSKSAGKQPFAAVLGYVLPHCPFIAKPDLFNYYYPRTDIPKVESEQPLSIQRYRKVRNIYDPPLDENRIRVARAAYYGLCEHIDGLIGDVLRTLDDTGLADNTLVMYTSDHGEMAGEHGCWWKSNYYEASAGVPLIARWPNVIKPGTVSTAVTNLMDIGPTLLDLADTDFDHDVDGRSMLNILTNEHDPCWLDETVCELVDTRGGVFPSRMIRSGPYKLWMYEDEQNYPPSLFDLSADPSECTDVWAQPEYKHIRSELTEKIKNNWNPALAAQKTMQHKKWFQTLSRWGRKVNIESPEALTYPSADYESDVELL